MTATQPVVARSRPELAAALASSSGARGHAAPYRRAVVMTMGALHDGHMELVREARRIAEQVVVTIFVNPLQFGPAEDLDRYPRDLAADLQLLAAAEVDVVFAPDVQTIYPDGQPMVRVAAGELGQRWEGAVRPGHFDGVLTVVCKLLHLTAPDVALFGQKDAQQLVLIQRMVRDLDLPVTIRPVPTARDADGLALSSRNSYLTADQRQTALAIPRAIFAGARAAEELGTPVAVRQAAASALAQTTDLDLDYLAVVDPLELIEVEAHYRGPALLAVAARVGTTRLIDNVPVELNGPRVTEGPQG